MRNHSWKRRLLVLLAAAQLALPAPAMAGDPIFRIKRIWPWAHDDVGHKPQTGQSQCVEELAKNIDWLEHQIDVYGTVTAKVPDVWGEARLTAHRQEFEQQLKAQLNLFDPDRLNGAEFVSDQAFIAFALAVKGVAQGATLANGATATTTSVVTAPNADASITDGGPNASISVDITGPTKVLGTSTDGSVVSIGDNVKLEQTEVLDQLARYVRHLQEHRRINEGDDTSDAPGYAMNLVRIPISVLSGQRTKKGCAAEITITAEPYLGPELLPTAYREFVINDLVDQLSVPLTRYLNDDPLQAKSLVEGYAAPLTTSPANLAVGAQLAPSPAAETQMRELGQKLSVMTIPATSMGRSTLPFPPSQIVENFGHHQCVSVISAAFHGFRTDLLNRNVVHVTDVQAFLREELGSAYELLQTEQMRHVWEEAAAQPRRLVDLVRLRRIPELNEERNRFLQAIDENAQRHNDQSLRTVTTSLAWAVYLESVLLNERLVQDMKETFGNRPTAPCASGWMQFFGPEPPEESRMAFAEYVRVRWPLKVFALDPVVTEQNIADVRSIYRQMQMSIALAFSQRQVGTSAALQAVRKLQRDSATIDLNRTVVSFGHGDDTFGWRFYPRFQTPPVESNLTVFFRDLVVGGPTDDQLERQKQIEPGMRECVAIVLMPSFVPHVTFHTRGNWFRMGCNTRTAASMTDTVEYSRAVKQMETNAVECTQCAHLYRDGEVDRLLKRVHQLDRELALQTLQCQVPIENTHGGFKIFAGGTRELAPELTGWYGTPGYDPANGCDLFLSGDNFNVTTSSLVVGNRNLKFELLSRQILKVTLPPGLAVIRDQKLIEAEKEFYDGYVDAQIATPYGVSGHLLIPVVRPVRTEIARFRMLSQTIRLKATAKLNDDKKTYAVTLAPPPAETPLLAIFDVPSNLGLGTAAKRDFFLTPAHGPNRLATTTVSADRAVSGRGYEVNANDSSTQLSTGGLATSLSHYLTWLVNSGSSPVATYDISFSATTGDDGSVPVEGTSTISIEVAKE